MILQRKHKEGERSLADILWYVDERLKDGRVRTDIIVPTGHIHVVYNFGDSYYWKNESGSQKIPDIVLVGQFKGAMEILYGERVRQLGIAFKPPAFYSLFHKFSGLYTGAVVDCAATASMLPMHEAVASAVDQYAETAEKMLDEIDVFFKNQGDMNADQSIYESMAEYLEIRRGVVDIEEMAETFGCSVSSLERRFKKNIGLTPKAYAGILRFRNAVTDKDPITLFYDQSHFIKNCRQYTKKNPAALSQSEELSLLHMLDLEEG